MPRTAAQRRASHELVIPDKLYFRIGDVAKLCDVETYVLRFWETEFPQLRPNKSGTGQRLYRRREVELAMRIRKLLHEEGYTIAGARQLLAQEVRATKAKQMPLIEGAAVDAKIQHLRGELRELLGILSRAPVRTYLHREPRSAAGSKPRPDERSPGPRLFE
ncbi:MAG TPA: MerR family transcriptional regulator [Acidobacteriaceae bacterium]|jgi:DNA-binding transcriptional MerR regulator|nr:MerR family transcriptional regulator [Acidobacteriaceae bacterium]